MLLAIARVPADDGALVEAARLTGLTPLDVRERLAGALPRVLLADTDSERVTALAAQLERRGFIALTCDLAAVPHDDERVVARSVTIEEDRLVVKDGRDEETACPFGVVSLVQRGLRAVTTARTTSTMERKLDAARAILSGGLAVSKKVETTSTTSVTTQEPFLLLHRDDGEADLMIYERRIDYRPLGPSVLPSSRANFDRLAERLRALLPTAVHDDRLSRPGFTAGLRYVAGDPVDLGLFLVRMAQLRG